MRAVGRVKPRSIRSSSYPHSAYTISRLMVPPSAAASRDQGHGVVIVQHARLRILSCRNTFAHNPSRRMLPSTRQGFQRWSAAEQLPSDRGSHTPPERTSGPAAVHHGVEQPRVADLLAVELDNPQGGLDAGILSHSRWQPARRLARDLARRRQHHVGMGGHRDGRSGPGHAHAIRQVCMPVTPWSTAASAATAGHFPATSGCS
jgi:hypothetical protein